MSDEELIQDPLFLACTRPAMIFGVTAEAMLLNVMVTTIIFIAVNNVAYILIGVVVHFLFRLIISFDHNMFRLLFAFLETKGRYVTRRYWGGSSPTPLKLTRSYSGKDFGLVR
jgi:type IV secretion system protein VirB3